MADSKRWQIGLVGYGEVGRILAEDLRQQDIKVAAYDIKLAGEQGAALKEHAVTFGVKLAASHAERGLTLRVSVPAHAAEIARAELGRLPVGFEIVIFD